MKATAAALMAAPLLLPCSVFAKVKAHVPPPPQASGQWNGPFFTVLIILVAIFIFIVLSANRNLGSFFNAPALKLAEQQKEELAAKALAQKTFDSPLKPFTPEGLVLQRGELCYFQCDATPIIVQTVAHRVGGYGGLSVPIGHGIRVNTGALRSRSVKSQSLMSEGHGILSLTSHRVVWISSQTNHVNTLESILQLETVADGLKLTFTNRSPLAYVTGDVAAGIVLQKILARRAA